MMVVTTLEEMYGRTCRSRDSSRCIRKLLGDLAHAERGLRLIHEFLRVRRTNRDFELV
jgi:hypothetical protein